MGLLVVAAVVVFLIAAPSLDLGGEAQTVTVETDLGAAESARIFLDLDQYPTTIDALIDSTDLIYGESGKNTLYGGGGHDRSRRHPHPAGRALTVSLLRGPGHPRPRRGRGGPCRSPCHTARAARSSCGQQPKPCPRWPAPAALSSPFQRPARSPGGSATNTHPVRHRQPDYPPNEADAVRVRTCYRTC